MNDPSQALNLAYVLWPPPAPVPAPPPSLPADGMGFPPPGPISFAVGGGGGVNVARGTWMGRKKAAAALSGVDGAVGGGGGGFKARRFYSRKKANGGARFAPFAPRNTTSFLIRAKRAGGIASLVSPSPVTPAILPTPRLSPSREVLVDMAKEAWGVDGYGSMNGLIRLRSPSAVAEEEDEADEGGGGGGSSESDVEEHLDGVERRLDHDLSRFEMLYPGDADAAAGLEREVHVARLEEDNLTLKARLFLMEREMAEFRRRMQSLEDRCDFLERRAAPAAARNENNNDAADDTTNGGGAASGKSTVGDSEDGGCSSREE